jgi:hypothetical protein
MFLIWLGGTAVVTPVAMAGEDVAEATLTISNAVVNTTNCIAVRVTYPTNWLSANLKISSDLTGTGNWRNPVSKEVLKTVYSSGGEMPYWTEYFVKRPTVGPKFFQVVGTVNVVTPPPTLKAALIAPAPTTTQIVRKSFRRPPL